MRSSKGERLTTIVGKVDQIGLVKSGGVSLVHDFTLQGRDEQFQCRTGGVYLDWHIGLTFPGDRVRFVVKKGEHVVRKCSFVNLEV